MKKTLVFLAIAFLVSCGSSSNVIKSETVSGVDFSKYNTYDFYEVQASGDTIAARFGNGLSLIKAAINKEMQKRGLTQSQTIPDLKINLGIAVSEKAQTRETDWRTDGRMTYTGQRNYSWKSEEVVVGYYREGTLDLHLVDRVTNSLVWEGMAKDIIPEKSKNMTETINIGVENLFKNFPVKPN